MALYLLNTLVDRIKPCLRPRDAALQLRAHLVERRVRRGGGGLVAAAQVVEQLLRGHVRIGAAAVQRARHGAAELPELRLARVKLLLAGFQCLRAVGKLLRTAFIFGKTVCIVCFSLFIVLDRLVILSYAVGIFLLAVFELFARIVQLGARIGKLLLPVVVIAPAVVQFTPCVGKLLLGVGELFIGFGARIVQLPLRVGELVVRLVHQFVMAQRGTLIAERLEQIDHIVDRIVVLIVKGGQLCRAGNAQIRRRVVVERERLARQIEIRLDRATAECGRAALNAQVHRRADRADDGKAVARQRVAHLIARRERKRIAEGDAHQVEQLLLHHALVRARGQPALAKQNVVDPLRAERIDLDDRLRRARGGKGVDHIGALGGGDPLLRAERGDIAVCQSKR